MKERYEIYYDYCVELAQYKSGKQKLLKADSDAYLDEILGMSCYTWNDIRNEAGMLVGFLIVSVAPECHPAADFHIAEAYVRPEYRCHGYMSQMMKSQVEQHPGKWSLLILKQNRKAYDFWYQLFDSLSYRQKFVPDATLYGDDAADLDQLVFAPV